MLKISAGNEEFGLCGKWLLHGFKIAKLNLQGNPRLMQRSRSNRQGAHTQTFQPSPENVRNNTDDVSGILYGSRCSHLLH
jgi:hypothetical protein